VNVAPSPSSETTVSPVQRATVTPDALDAWFTSALDPLLPELYATARRLTRNATDAEDLTADAVARAWSARASLLDRDAFRPWIYRILSNTFTSWYRSAQARPAEESLASDDDAEHDFSLFERLHQPFLLWWGTPEKAFLNKLLREDLERAIESLPEHFRLVVVLADVQEFTYQAVADALQIPLGTVRSRLARGRALLQRALWQHGIDAGLVNDSPPPERR
jgi:RNA polymerase sigma-70 factor (ECF subfamily)